MVDVKNGHTIGRAKIDYTPHGFFYYPKYMNNII